MARSPMGDLVLRGGISLERERFMAPQRQFGSIPNYQVGSLFTNRKELSAAGVHRPPQAGISGSKADGADSTRMI